MTDPISVKTTNDISGSTGKLSEQVKPVNAEDKTKAKTSDVAANVTMFTLSETPVLQSKRAILLSSNGMGIKSSDQIASSAYAASADLPDAGKTKSEDKHRELTDDKTAIDDFKEIQGQHRTLQLRHIIEFLQKSGLDDFKCLVDLKDKITEHIKKDIKSINYKTAADLILIMKLIRDINIDDKIIINKIIYDCHGLRFLMSNCKFSEIFDISHILHSIKSDKLTLKPEIYLTALQDKTWNEPLNDEDVRNIVKTLKILTQYLPEKHDKNAVYIFKNILNKIKENDLKLTKETYSTLCDLMPHFQFIRQKGDPIQKLFSLSYHHNKSFVDFKIEYGNVIYLQDLISCLKHFNEVDTNRDESVLLTGDFFLDISNYILEAIEPPNTLEPEQVHVIYEFLKRQKINDEKLLRNAYELSKGENFLARCNMFQLYSITDSLVIMAGLDGIELLSIAHELINRLESNTIERKDHTFIPAIIQKIATFYAVKLNAREIETSKIKTPKEDNPVYQFMRLIELESDIKAIVDQILLIYSDYLKMHNIDPSKLGPIRQKQICQAQAYFRTLPIMFRFEDLALAPTTQSKSQDKIFSIIRSLISKQTKAEFVLDEYHAYHSPDIWEMGENFVVEYDGKDHFEILRDGKNTSTARTILRDQILKRGSLYKHEHYTYLESKSNRNQVEEVSLKSLHTAIVEEKKNPFKLLVISHKDMDGVSERDIVPFIKNKLEEIGIFRK